MRAEESTAVVDRVHKWLGVLPTGWAGARLLEVADAWTSNVDKHTVEGQPAVRLCNYVDVYKNDAITESIDFMSASATLEQIRKFRIRRDDTVITKDSETADDIGVPAFVEYEADDLICGYHLAIVRPDTRRVVPKFLHWALDSEPTARQWGVTAAGVTRVGIRSTDLNKVTIPLPPLDEQRAIADYLDQETAQIDTLVAKQEEFIELLRERRDAAWASGLERAIGERPPIPLRRAITSIVDGPFGSSLTSAHYSDSGTRVIRLGNIGINSFRAQDKAYIPDSYAEQLAGHNVLPGDVVIAGLGDETWPLGRAAVVPDIGPAIVKADCFRARPAPGVSGSYLAWALSAPQTRSQVALLARGSTRQRINTSIARTIGIPVPSPEHQKSILRDSEDELSRVDALIAKAEEHIALAKERRSALITAAVTGQFDVRTARKAG